MRITLPDVNESVIIEGVSWERFEELLEELGDHRGRRVAYDRGRLEISTARRSSGRLKVVDPPPISPIPSSSVSDESAEQSIDALLQPGRERFGGG